MGRLVTNSYSNGHQQNMVNSVYPSETLLN